MKISEYVKGIREIPSEFIYAEVIGGCFGVMYKNKTRYEKAPTNKFVLYKCRDRYQNVSNTKILRGGMFFSHLPNDGDRHKIFLEKIESDLKLEKRSRFQKTNRTDILFIRLSPWWLENKIRRSFLTLMLRSSKNYDPKLPWKQENVIAVASRCDYGMNTIPAIKRFMRGYTVCLTENPKLSYRGWVEIFTELNEIEVRRLLVKPK